MPCCRATRSCDQGESLIRHCRHTRCSDKARRQSARSGNDRSRHGDNRRVRFTSSGRCASLCRWFRSSIATAPGEAWYLPFRHVQWQAMQGELMIDAAGDRSPTDASEDRGLVSGGDDPLSPGIKAPTKKAAASQAEQRARANTGPVRNLPSLDSDEMKPLRDLLEDPSVRKTAQNCEVRCARAATRRHRPQGSRLRYDAGELRPGSGSAVARTRCSRTRVSRSLDDVVYRSLRQRQSQPFRSISARSIRRVITRAKKQTSLFGCARSSSRSSMPQKFDR